MNEEGLYSAQVDTGSTSRFMSSLRRRSGERTHLAEQVVRLKRGMLFVSEIVGYRNSARSCVHLNRPLIAVSEETG